MATVSKDLTKTTRTVFFDREEVEALPCKSYYSTSRVVNISGKAIFEKIDGNPWVLRSFILSAARLKKDGTPYAGDDQEYGVYSPHKTPEYWNLLKQYWPEDQL